MRHLTYRKLREALDELPEESLDMDVTVFIPGIDEFHAIGGLEIAGNEQDVLDEGHPYMEIANY